MNKEKFSQYKHHPWHGVSPGDELPKIVTAFIEIVPGDTIKYEVDKTTGYLKIDRPQLFSNTSPALYGFIPQTYCGNLIAEFCSKESGKKIERGDGDPLDICVLCERSVTHGDIVLRAIPIGGLRMIDKGEADDKIIAVLFNDPVYSQYKDISELPKQLVDRLRHYFLTYKVIPGESRDPVEIDSIYNREAAHEVIRRSVLDYQELIGK